MSVGLLVNGNRAGYSGKVRGSQGRRGSLLMQEGGPPCYRPSQVGCPGPAFASQLGLDANVLCGVHALQAPFCPPPILKMSTCSEAHHQQQGILGQKPSVFHPNLGNPFVQKKQKKTKSPTFCSGFHVSANGMAGEKKRQRALKYICC